MLPSEFVIPGSPVSYQTNDRKLLRAWRESIQAAARLRWSAGVVPRDSRLKITAVYSHTGDTIRMDSDNMLKPIQDALTGII